MSIWEICNGNAHLTAINQEAWRIVEDQYKPATRKLVDTLQEQQLLEDLIESVKPRQEDYFNDYHYLLRTPFRYPPLAHGSRFAPKTEPSLWYGSLSIETAMAEKAFYRFAFLIASDAKYKPLPLRYTAFTSAIGSDKGIDLTARPFSAYKTQISSPSSYHDSQALGQKMRFEGVETFLYASARCPREGTNIALFSPKSFLSRNPKEPFQSWQCQASVRCVEFTRTHALTAESWQFPIKLFLFDGKLPTLT